MKTWEMIKELTENPEKEFETLDFYGDKLIVYNIETISYDDSTGNNVIVTKYCDGRVTPLVLNNFLKNRKWEEVKKPVSWQEAIQAWIDGKSFKILLPNGRTIHQSSKDRLGLLSSIPNGLERWFFDYKFYIED